MCTDAHSKRRSPLPLLPLLVVAWVTLSESLTLTITLPFVPFMVQDFFHFDPTDPSVGFYSGIILGTAFLAEFLGSYPWGWAADRIGRRPVIVYGLAVSTLTIPLFGFSTSFAMAVAARAARGLLNGVSGTTKTYLAEITDATNRTAAFSVISTAFGIGMLVGPLLGGFLSRPATSFPALFGHLRLFRRFPYALPTLVCGTASAAATVVAVFAIDETLKHKRSLFPAWRPAPVAASALLEPLPPAASEGVGVGIGGGGGDDGGGGCGGVGGGGVHRVGGVGVSVGSDSCGGGGGGGGTPDGGGGSGGGGSSASGRGLGCLAWQSAALYGAVALYVVMQQEMFPLWAKLPRREGGLYWGTNSIGLVLAVGGVGILTGSMLLFPLLAARLGMLRTFQLAHLTAVVATFLLPYFNSIQPHLSHAALVALLASLFFVSFAAFASMFSATMLFISNSVAPHALGRANGIGQSFASMARAIGPVCAGPLVAGLAGRGKPPLGVHAAFAITALFGCLSLGLSCCMRGIEGRRWQAEQEESLRAPRMPPADAHAAYDRRQRDDNVP